MRRPWRDLDELVRTVEGRATHLSSQIHGPSHWRAVGATAAELVAAPPPGPADVVGDGGDAGREPTGPDPVAADRELLLLFALLHDACRLDDGRDLEHGPRAEVLLADLRTAGHLDLAADRADVLAEALRDHTAGGLSVEPTIAVCWDADRLLIGRVGIVPDPRFCSTAEGRRRAHDGALPDLVGPPTWSAVAVLLGVA
ncbi:MAG: hypothetical protein M0P31_15610 [Solirubrobacteraceae bacterium]|nr:hypothetical protein [Solirubrobacteraceae bacterium]